MCTEIERTIRNLMLTKNRTASKGSLLLRSCFYITPFITPMIPASSSTRLQQPETHIAFSTYPTLII